MKKILSRQQISRIVNGDQEAIRAMEELFRQVQELTPQEVQDILQRISDNETSAGDLRGSIAVVSQAVNDVADIGKKAIAAVDDSILLGNVPITPEKKETIPAIVRGGESGAFTTADGKIITVENGLITRIQ